MKVLLNSFYGVQEIHEVDDLEDIEEAGTYAVKGYDRPVSVEPVTPYGESEIGRRYPNTIFFVGADGRTYYGMKCGEFA